MYIDIYIHTYICIYGTDAPPKPARPPACLSACPPARLTARPPARLRPAWPPNRLAACPADRPPGLPTGLATSARLNRLTVQVQE